MAILVPLSTAPKTLTVVVGMGLIQSGVVSTSIKGEVFRAIISSATSLSNGSGKSPGAKRTNSFGGVEGEFFFNGT